MGYRSYYALSLSLDLDLSLSDPILSLTGYDKTCACLPVTAHKG